MPFAKPPNLGHGKSTKGTRSYCHGHGTPPPWVTPPKEPNECRAPASFGWLLIASALLVAMTGATRSTSSFSFLLCYVNLYCAVLAGEVLVLMFWSSRGRESLGSGGIRAKEVPRAGQCCLRTGGPKTDFQHANQRGAANQELHQSDYARFTPRQMYTRTAAITSRQQIS